MNDIIRIVIVDDHPLFRSAVTYLLKGVQNFQIVGEGGTADEAIRLTHELHPDILLLDISMPGGGLNSARIVSLLYPDTRVVILTASQMDDDLVEAAQAGACAYVFKGVSGRELIRILNSVFNGDCLMTSI